MKSAFLFVLILPLALFLLVLSGCSEDESGPTSPDENEEDPILQVSVTSLDFGEEETTLQFIVTNTGGQELEWTITTDSDWIEIFPAAGVTRDESDTVSVTVDRADMVNGEYTDTISVMTTDSQNWTISASMSVAGPILQVSVTSLDFGEEETTHQFVVTNTGGQELEWTITTDSDWIEIFPAAGVTRDESDTVSVTVDRADMVHGEYADTISVMTTDSQNWTISVSMSVPAPDPVTLLNWNAITLDEDHHVHSNQIVIPYEGLLAMNMQLHDWPGHYGLEVFVMSPTEYNHYANGDGFSVYWHETISTEGSHIRVASGLIAEGTTVIIVVDNTDRGWEDTDFDFVNDDALFNLEIALGPVG